MVKYYGYDGYFINQEIIGDLVEFFGEKMCQFMFYIKEYAVKVNYLIKYFWYDVMIYNYGRYY